MNAVFLSSFIAGLLWGVQVMLFGVERSPAASPAAERSFRLSPTVLVSFLIVFGVSGYLLERSGLATGVTIGAAVLLGAAAAAATARLVNKWWRVVPTHDVEDPRYALQGHLARVVTTIQTGGVGTIDFDVDAVHHVVPARSIGDEELPAGTEVVIERVEDDIAYVEAWSQVEQRL